MGEAMTVIGVTSRPYRGYIALYRGYVAAFRGYVAHQAHNPLYPLSFSACFCPLPSFYLLSTSGALWTTPSKRLAHLPSSAAAELKLTLQRCCFIDLLAFKFKNKGTR